MADEFLRKDSKQTYSLLLVNPSLNTRQYSREDRLRSYLSLGALASALLDNNFIKKWIRLSGRNFRSFNFPEGDFSFDVRVLNLSLRPKNQGTGEYFESYVRETGIHPILIGLTATSAHLDEAREIGDAAARIFPQALRVIGGPHVSVSSSDFLRRSRFHAACRGEGVETLLDLLLAFLDRGLVSLADVPGIDFKDTCGEIRSNPPRKFLFDLDGYPFPSDSLHLFLDDIHDRHQNSRDLVYILAGSGCPHHCVFCAQQAIYRGRIRERSAENIFAEMQSLFDKGFRKFAIVQETFLRDPERAARFCSLIENSGLPFEWTIEARADQLSRENMGRMKRAGLRFLQLGVESGDQKLLDTLRKNIQLRQVIQARDWAEELEIDTAFYLLVGLPDQGWQSILRSAIFLKDHLPFNRVTRHISTAVAIPYPGSEIYEGKKVRLIGLPEGSWNWPERNCAVEADEAGAFIGRNFTETDVMSPEEILEAYICLDDLGAFLLEAKYNPQFSPDERSRAREFAWHAFHMIGRRTIRDLIIRAQADLSPEKYRRGREQILSRDRGQESHLKDLAPSAEPWPDLFSRFLAQVDFANGFESMKVLSVPNRIKWMKVCAAVWGAWGQNFSRVGFASDEEEQGKQLNELLDRLSGAAIDDLLEGVEQGQKLHLTKPDGTLEIFGLRFDFKRMGPGLEVHRIAVA
ncbi:MAG: radical SAM protein [Syntrophaceae bacterium]|nr:radical SAM protein [Syntrophaceae bacterium]